MLQQAKILAHCNQIDQFQEPKYFCSELDFPTAGFMDKSSQ
jgi:hypothetical protein